MSRNFKLFVPSEALVILAAVLFEWFSVSHGQIGLAQAGKTITVCASGCDFSKIQAAIDTVPGGSTIQVQTGTYQENLTITGKQDLTLQGAGMNAVTLDGSAGVTVQSPAISIQNSQNITIQGLKIIKSRQGLAASNSTGLTIADNTVENNLRAGIGLFSGSEAQIKGTIVRGTQPDRNGASGDGIGIYYGSQAVLTDNTVTDNADGGVVVEAGDQPSQVQGSNNTVQNNKGGDLQGNVPTALLAQPPPEGTLDQVAVHADAPTIQEAVNKVKVGGTITLAAGTYRGLVQIYKSVTIRGAGPDQTVLQAPGPDWVALNIATDQIQVTVEGLKVTGGRRGVQIATGPSGSVTLHNVRAEGNGSGKASDAGALIFDQATVTLNQAKISGNQAIGVVAHNQATITIQDSTIANNAGVAGINVFVAGIDIYGNSKATISQSAITDNAAAGIFAGDRASVTIEGNTIARNVGGGIRMGNSSQVEIVNNQITENKTEGQHFGNGILAYGKSRATIQKNTIEGNAIGILLRDNVQATIQGNTISDNNGHNGISMDGSSSATIEQNVIARNADGGIGLFDSSQAEIVNNEITENKPNAQGKYGDGIYAGGNSAPTIQNNKIERNADVGISLSGTAQSTIQGNTIADNNGIGGGIIMGQNSSAKIEENVITRNTDEGINVGDSAQAEIINNEITENKRDAQGKYVVFGIRASGKSRLTIQKNAIEQNEGFGIGLLDSAQATITDNSIASNAQSGIGIGDVSVDNETVKAEVTSNTIQSNNLCGVAVDSDPGITLTGQDNLISGNSPQELCGDMSKFPAGFGGGM
jgi:parallel beta-helix repeat protein